MNFVFRAEFRLRGRISSAWPEPRTLSNSVFGPNFVFRTNFVFTNEFRLQCAPNRILSSQEFRLHGRFSSSHFVFAHNLSFSSLRTISSSKASEFRLQGGNETGTHFPGFLFAKVQKVLDSRVLKQTTPAGPCLESVSIIVRHMRPNTDAASDFARIVLSHLRRLRRPTSTWRRDERLARC